MSLLGLHHITMVSSDARRTTEFYRGLLGLHLVKKTVNFDDPASYHLYFGDATGTPGTLLTFFEWRHAPGGRWGIGATHHLALCVETPEAQLKWKRRLTAGGVAVTGPYDRHYFRSIYFTDPDGLILEIATRGPGWTVDEPADALGSRMIDPPPELTRTGRDEEAIEKTTWPEPVESISADMQLQGLHHITAIASDIEQTTDFYTGTLGFRTVKRTVNYDDTSAPHLYFGIGSGPPGTIVTYFGYPTGKMRHGSMGTGLTHHFAFAVADEQEQREWREKLLDSGMQVTPVLDRKYFRSIYFSDPDGHILEIATARPGFLVDETPDVLGHGLALPAWLEKDRQRIASTLTPIPDH